MLEAATSETIRFALLFSFSTGNQMKNTVLLLAILTSLAVSCTPKDPNPPPAQVLGLVEFTLEDNSAQLQSGSGLTVSATNLTSSNLPSITPAGSATTSDFAGRRYLSASFNLQNPPGGVNYDNLTFHAVTVDGTIVGGSSLAGTGLRNLRDSSGAAITDATVARGVKPTHKLVNLSGALQVDASGADFQVFDPMGEVNPVQIAINAIPALNGHVTALGYGFVARKAATNPARGITAGQSGVVTLGLHFPISPAAPRSLSLTYIVVNETATRVTEASEEQGASSGAVTRAQALGLGVSINTLPGSGLTGARTVCPVVWAVSSAGLPAWMTDCQMPPPSEATYLVGPTRPFKTLQAVMNNLKPGDIVELDGDVSYPSLIFTASGTVSKPIIVRGRIVNGKRPVIQGYAAASGFAGVKFVGSDHVVFDNLEITNGADANKTQTTACVFNEADDVTLRRVRVRDCPNHGILGADTDSGSLTLEEVEVTTSGCDVTLSMTCNGTSLKHPIYVATDPGTHPGAMLRIVNSYLHGNNAGENIKTRAERVQIVNNWLETTASQYRNLGLYGYQEYTAGVDAPVIHHDIVGNVIVERGSSSAVRAGGDGTGSTRGRTRFVNNTIVLDSSFGAQAKPVIRLDGDLESLELHNNLVAVVAGNESLQLIRENDDLTWIGAGGKPKLVVTHTNLGAGSTLLRVVNGTVYTLSNLPPASSGYRFETTTSLMPGFVNASSLQDLNLHLMPGSPLHGLGTAVTNTAGYEIPWSLPFPPREVPTISLSGEPVAGVIRGDAAKPSVGAYP